MGEVHGAFSSNASSVFSKSFIAFSAIKSALFVVQHNCFFLPDTMLYSPDFNLVYLLGAGGAMWAHTEFSRNSHFDYDLIFFNFPAVKP